MAKATRKYDLVFGADEVKLVNLMLDETVKKIAYQFYIDRGMTEKEIEEKIKFGQVWEMTQETKRTDGEIVYVLKGLEIEVEETLD